MRTKKEIFSSCIICGQQFLVKNKNSKVCSKECHTKFKETKRRQKNNTLELSEQKECKECAKLFSPSRKKSSFCSKKCEACYTYKNKKTFSKVCQHCFKDFETKKKDTRFCSQHCVIASVRKKNDDVELICQTCKNVFVRPYQKRKVRFCSPKCSAIYSASIRDKVSFAEKISATKKELFKKGLLFVSDEQKKKTSDTLRRRYIEGSLLPATLGKKASAETKKKFSEARRGKNNSFYGKTHSKEVKELLSLLMCERVKKGFYTNPKLYKSGFHTSPKVQGGEIHYRSSWELIAYKYLDTQDEVLNYSTETLSIPYKDPESGYERNYLPDLIINFDNGDKKMIEIKPMVYKEYPINLAKFDAAKSFCEENGFSFEVWTGEEIYQMEEKIFNI